MKKYYCPVCGYESDEPIDWDACIRRAYDAVTTAGLTVTDDAGALEIIKERARLVDSRKPNFKITVSDDLAVAEKLLRT